MILNERGEIISSSIGKNRDGDVDVRILKTQLIESEDSQTIQQYQLAGFESRPPDGSKIIVADLGGGSYKISIAEDDGVLNNTLNKGDSIHYGSDGGAVVSFVLCKNNGKIQLGNGTDELLSLLDELLEELQKTVDLTGSASTGTLFKINTALADIQTRLGNIKV